MRPVLLCLLLVSLLACGGTDPDGANDVAVRVGGIGLDPLTDTPVVVLEEEGGERSLPIWIGEAEARSIASEMERVVPLRPNTHDLAKRLLRGLEATVDRAIVTDLQEGTYYAVLVVHTGGRRVEIDSRPSDAIAIALRVHAPLFVRSLLFEDADEEERPERAEEMLPSDEGLSL